MRMEIFSRGTLLGRGEQRTIPPPSIINIQFTRSPPPPPRFFRHFDRHILQSRGTNDFARSGGGSYKRRSQGVAPLRARLPKQTQYDVGRFHEGRAILTFFFARLSLSRRGARHHFTRGSRAQRNNNMPFDSCSVYS